MRNIKWFNVTYEINYLELFKCNSFLKVGYSDNQIFNLELLNELKSYDERNEALRLNNTAQEIPEAIELGNVEATEFSI